MHFRILCFLIEKGVTDYNMHADAELGWRYNSKHFLKK